MTTFRFIRKTLELNCFGLELPAELFDKELENKNSSLLCVFDNSYKNDSAKSIMMRERWQQLNNNISANKDDLGRQVRQNEKVLVCSIFSPKLKIIGKIQIKGDENGCGEITLESIESAFI